VAETRGILWISPQEGEKSIIVSGSSDSVPACQSPRKGTAPMPKDCAIQGGQREEDTEEVGRIKKKEVGRPGRSLVISGGRPQMKGPGGGEGTGRGKHPEGEEHHKP